MPSFQSAEDRVFNDVTGKRSCAWQHLNSFFEKPAGMWTVYIVLYINGNCSILNLGKSCWKGTVVFLTFRFSWTWCPSSSHAWLLPACMGCLLSSSSSGMWVCVSGRELSVQAVQQLPAMEEEQKRITSKGRQLMKRSRTCPDTDDYVDGLSWQRPWQGTRIGVGSGY